MSWFAGLGVIVIATSSSVGVYDTTLFSVHSVQHMLLQMIAPAPLAIAAPITLALRTLPARPRRVLLAIVHSRVVRTVSHPLVAYGLFVISPLVLLYSPLFEATLTNDLLHNLMHVHFVLVGALFYFPWLRALRAAPSRRPRRRSFCSTAAPTRSTPAAGDMSKRKSRRGRADAAGRITGAGPSDQPSRLLLMLSG